MRIRHIVPNEFVSNFYKNKSFADNLISLSKVKKYYWVTLGDKGCMRISNGLARYYPSLNMPIIDNLGAGDLFRAAYLYGLTKKYDDDFIGRFANNAALLQCMRKGNCSAAPELEEVFSFSESNNNPEIIEYSLDNLKDFNMDY